MYTRKKTDVFYTNLWAIFEISKAFFVLRFHFYFCKQVYQMSLCQKHYNQIHPQCHSPGQLVCKYDVTFTQNKMKRQNLVTLRRIYE